MKEWLRKCQLVTMLSLAGMAPALVFGVHAYADRLWVCTVFAALHGVLGCLCLLIPGRRRIASGVLLSLLIAGAGIWLLPWQEKWWSLLLSLLYMILLFRSLPVGGWSADQELPFNVVYVGGGLYAAAQLMQMLPSGVYADIGTPLLIGFLVYAALWMLSLNRQSLLDAASRGQRAPVAMRRRNTVFTVALMALILLISAIPALARALRWAWDKLMQLIHAVLRFLASLLPETTVSSGTGGEEMSMGMLGEVSEPGLFAQIMEKIFMVLAIVLLAAALFAAGRILWRKLRVLLRRLWSVLNRYALAASEDYVDEVADTREGGETASSGRRRGFGEWLKQVNEDRLSPVERIRYRYRRLLRRHSEWTPGSTARENLPSEAAVLYERARYGAEEMSPEEAETFALHAKTLEKKG